MNADELLRPADVEALFGPGLNVKTLERMRRDGNGPDHRKISARRVEYRRSDVQAWIDKHWQEGAA